MKVLRKKKGGGGKRWPGRQLKDSDLNFLLSEKKRFRTKPKRTTSKKSLLMTFSSFLLFSTG